jgi:hypothetical protein
MELTQEHREQIKDIAELEVRKYFDHYQTNIFPQQLTVIIAAHNTDEAAHGGVEKKIARFIWIGTGICLASGSMGALVTKAMGAFGG